MNGGAAPALPVWTPPPGWRAIDFISDLHLAPDHPRTVRAWSHYMACTRADAVVMLGDVFEAWVGDDSRDLAFEGSLVAAIRSATSRLTVAFMPGNRDFLVGPALLEATGMQALQDPTCLANWGDRWLLAHGDAQCLQDHRYQAFRAQVRDPSWQRAFLARPLAERLELARAMRQESMRLQQGATESVGDLDAEACRHLLRRAGATLMLHGHTHRPATHDLGDGLRRLVLSDWELDDLAAPRAEVLRLSADGRLQRLSPDDACRA